MITNPSAGLHPANYAGQVTGFDDIYKRAQAMVDAQKERIDLQRQMQAVFLLQWDFPNASEHPWIMPTVDPQPHNAIRWLVDVLSTSDPQWDLKIPEEALASAPKYKKAVERAAYRRLADWVKQLGKAKEPPEKQAEIYENILRYIFAQNDQRQDRRLLRDVLLNLFVTDQAVVKCIDLRLSKLWKKESPDMKGKSPFLFKSVPPTEVYYEYDDGGLSAVLHRYIRPIRLVKAVYGDAAMAKNDYVTQDENGNVMFAEFWTRDEKYAWIERTTTDVETPRGRIDETVQKQNILDESANTLGFIPFVIKTANGSSMAGAEILPTNYAGAKSNIFHRANLFLTVTSSLAFRRANPQYKRLNVPPGTPPMKLDYTQPNVYDLPPGQDIQELQEHLDEDLYRVMQVIMQKSDESTAPKALVGQAPGGVTAAAAFNMIIEGGKLILLPVQEAAKELYRSLGQMTFDYIRAYGEMDGHDRYPGKDVTMDHQGGGASGIDATRSALEIWTNNGQSKVDPEAIPTWMDIGVRIEPDLPKDRIALWNMAVQAYAAHMIPLDYAWDVMGVKDKNRLRELLDEESGRSGDKEKGGQEDSSLSPPLPVSPSPNLPSQALAPNVAAGLPVEQNPSVDTLGEQLASAVQNQNRIPR